MESKFNNANAYIFIVSLDEMKYAITLQVHKRTLYKTINLPILFGTERLKNFQDWFLDVRELDVCREGSYKWNTMKGLEN